MIATLRKRSFTRLAAMMMLAGCFFSASAQTTALSGRELFLDASKGNCAACHQVPGDSAITSKSRIGPELAGIKQRYSDRALLRAAIWNLGEKVPGTIMPPYGKHRILTESEIDAVVRYLETL